MFYPRRWSFELGKPLLLLEFGIDALHVSLVPNFSLNTQLFSFQYSLICYDLLSFLFQVTFLILFYRGSFKSIIQYSCIFMGFY